MTTKDFKTNLSPVCQPQVLFMVALIIQHGPHDQPAPMIHGHHAERGELVVGSGGAAPGRGYRHHVLAAGRIGQGLDTSHLRSGGFHEYVYI